MALFKKPVVVTEGVGAAPLTFSGDRAGSLSFVGRLLKGRKVAGKIERNLVTAGLLVKPNEFLALNLLVWAVVLMLGLLYVKSMPPIDGFFTFVKRILWVLFFFRFGWKLPQMVLQFLADRRRTTLEYQLTDALTIISSGLKGGYSFIQGLDMAATQLDAPIKDEFSRVMRLVQLGLDTPRALEQMAERINSYDYDMTVSATNIQLAVGGNLSALLEGIAATVRDRIRLRRDIGALTAQGRISGGILMALPVGIAVMLKFLNPEYMGYLLDTDLGMNFIYFAIGQWTIGLYWIKKLLDFDN